jgi:uncharacterized protein YjiS (DUF1127 family)
VFIITALRAISAYFETIRIREQLSGMDARMLSDMGLTRGDIENVATGHLMRDRSR